MSFLFGTPDRIYLFYFVHFIKFIFSCMCFSPVEMIRSFEVMGQWDKVGLCNFKSYDGYIFMVVLQQQKRIYL